MINPFRFVFLRGDAYEKYKKSKIRELELIAGRDDLKDKIVELAKEVARIEINEKRSKEIIDIDLGDPSPTDLIKRKKYVAEVAGLHKEILEPKFKQMISTSHNFLESEETERDFDLIMKGVVYTLRELLKWGDSMVSEQIANQLGQNPSSPEDKDNKIKE